MNDNLTPALDRVLQPIPFEVIGKPGRRASERDRDNAAMELVGYVTIMLRFGVASDWQEQLLKRANKVRRTQGNGDVVFINDAAERVLAAARAPETAS